MIRVASQDFYVFEPALLKSGRVVMPERWFTRYINNVQVFFALAYSLVPTHTTTGRPHAYVINQYEKIEIAADNLLLAFPTMCDTFRVDGMPDPRLILGIMMRSDY